MFIQSYCPYLWICFNIDFNAAFIFLQCPSQWLFHYFLNVHRRQRSWQRRGVHLCQNLEVLNDPHLCLHTDTQFHPMRKLSNTYSLQTQTHATNHSILKSLLKLLQMMCSILWRTFSLLRARCFGETYSCRKQDEGLWILAEALSAFSTQLLCARLCEENLGYRGDQDPWLSSVLRRFRDCIGALYSTLLHFPCP